MSHSKKLPWISLKIRSLEKNFSDKSCRVSRGTSIGHLDHDLQGQIGSNQGQIDFLDENRHLISRFRKEQQVLRSICPWLWPWPWPWPQRVFQSWSIMTCIVILYEFYSCYIFIFVKEKNTCCNLCNLYKIYILISEEV